LLNQRASISLAPGLFELRAKNSRLVVLPRHRRSVVSKDQLTELYLLLIHPVTGEKSVDPKNPPNETGHDRDDEESRKEMGLPPMVK
jgi:hypothetical protein